MVISQPKRDRHIVQWQSATFIYILLWTIAREPKQRRTAASLNGGWDTVIARTTKRATLKPRTPNTFVARQSRFFFFFFTTQRYTKDTSRAPAQYISSSLYQGETIFTYMGAREGIDVGGICARRNSTPIFGLRGCTRTVFPPPVLRFNNR
jgi:hypothetical protein